MATSPTDHTAAVQEFTPADFAEHERTYNGFMALVKMSIISMALLIVGLYFILFGGSPIFGGFLILLSIVVPPVMSVWQRR